MSESPSRRLPRKTFVAVAVAVGVMLAPVAAHACSDHYNHSEMNAAEHAHKKSVAQAKGKGRAVDPGAVVTTPPSAAMKNVEFVGQLPEAVGATAINFLDFPKVTWVTKVTWVNKRVKTKRWVKVKNYKKCLKAKQSNKSKKCKKLRTVVKIKKVKKVTKVKEVTNQKVMFVTGRFGLKSYDATNAAKPVLLDTLDMPGFWQNEDMDVDTRRKLVFMARDPRAFGQNQGTGESGVYIVSAADPANLDVISYASVPAGHTTTCVNQCDYLWTGGPRPADWQPEDWEGRPIFVTDIRDPKNPVTLGQPVDMARNDGVTDYAHDVQIDDQGVVWVSGAGGIRGYWTHGKRWDPLKTQWREATAMDPVPYAGGKFYQSNQETWGGSLAHNADRPNRAIGNYKAGQLAFVTIENFTPTCETDGRLMIVDLGDSNRGQAWTSTPARPYRLKTVGEWSPNGQEGSKPGAGCSAHYFQMKGNIIAQSYYGNGTHFIDVSDPTNPTQVGYYRAEGGNNWAPYWNGEYMYIADGNRGVDIVRPTAAMRGGGLA